MKESGKEGSSGGRVLGYGIVSGSSARPVAGVRVLQPECPEGPALSQE